MRASECMRVRFDSNLINCSEHAKHVENALTRLLCRSWQQQQKLEAAISSNSRCKWKQMCQSSTEEMFALNLLMCVFVCVQMCSGEFKFEKKEEFWQVIMKKEGRGGKRKLENWRPSSRRRCRRRIFTHLLTLTLFPPAAELPVLSP